MATPSVNNLEEVVVEERLKGPDQRAVRSPKAKSSSLRHKTRFPTESVRQSEESLRQLIDDFEHGRLTAFGMLATTICF